MKRLLLTLQSLLIVFCGMAQNKVVLTCSSEGKLAILLKEHVDVNITQLIVDGPMNADDARSINDYPNISVLNLTKALLPVVPDSAWTNLHFLQELYLPKDIDTLSLDAISCSTYGVNIYLPGEFPYLKNYPKVVRSAPGYYFSLTYDNEVLVHDESLGILSSDRKTLYKVTQYGMMEPTRYSVEKVCNYAFAQTIAGNGGDMEFSSELKEISNSAFVGMAITSATRGEIDSQFFCVRFEGNQPPKKTGEGNLNIGIFDYEHFDALAVIVPDVETYIKDDGTWGDLQIFSLKDWYEYKEQERGIESVSVAKDIIHYYDLQGRPVANPTRGIYIKDGRKVILK